MLADDNIQIATMTARDGVFMVQGGTPESSGGRGIRGDSCKFDGVVCSILVGCRAPWKPGVSQLLSLSRLRQARMATTTKVLAVLGVVVAASGMCVCCFRLKV